MACLGLVYSLFKVGLPFIYGWFRAGLLLQFFFSFRLVFTLLGDSVGVL